MIAPVGIYRKRANVRQQYRYRIAFGVGTVGGGPAWTATTTGNVNDGATFGNTSPGVEGTDFPSLSGDHTITVNNGVTLTINVDATFGSNSSGVGHAIELSGASAGSFATLVVSDGVTLTLKGNDTTSNTAMLINRYATLAPDPGATISVDCASDFQTVIDNRGIIDAVGTAPKPITFTSPEANVDWDNDVAGEVQSGSGHRYDPEASLSAKSLDNPWIANAAGTGLGSFGDSSLSFAAQSPGTILQTEVATVGDVDAAGEYYVDYDQGFVFFNHNYAAGNPSYEATYKHLTLGKGWGIKSVQDTTYNEAKFDYCDFRYMGTDAATDTRAVDIENKKATSVEANRVFSLENSTVEYCGKFLGIEDCTGASGDEILIDGNTFGYCKGSANYGYTITAYRGASTYVNVTNNTGSAYNLLMVFATAPESYSNWEFSGNDVYSFSRFISITRSLQTPFPNCLIENNNIRGLGSGEDGRLIMGLGGTSGNEATIRGNLFDRCARSIFLDSHVVIEKNRIYLSLHHGFPASNGDGFIENVLIQNNLFYNETTYYDASPSVEMGYNQKHWLDDVRIVNNTFVGNPSGAVGFGDIQDANTFGLCTRLQVANNLALMNTSGTSTAWRRRAHSTASIFRLHCLRFDYNLDYNYNARYDANVGQQGSFTIGGSNYNELTSPSRDITGVALFDPNFSSASSKQLDFTYTSPTDQTLAWDGGTAIQLVLDNGTATSGSNTSSGGVEINGVLNDTAKSWTTTKNDSACPINHWVKITGGTGSGQIRGIINNTATALTVVPAWTTAPSTDSTYVIIKAEVTLDDAADTVEAGIYLPELPTSTESDTGIDFADNSVTGSDPLLSDSTGVLASDYYLTAGSAADGAGVSVTSPTDDYAGISRGTPPDIGFDELVTATGSPMPIDTIYRRLLAG